MATHEGIRVEVVFALPGEQRVIELTVPRGTTAREAVDMSGIAARAPAAVAPDLRLGIYGRVVADGTVLADGDRVEIYRPLVADPKQARRRRAATVAKSESR